MSNLTFVLIIGIMIAILSAGSVRALKQDERLVILRLGRCVGVGGPGLVFLLPILDKGVRVKLDESIVGWRGMSRSELDKRVQEVALQSLGTT